MIPYELPDFPIGVVCKTPTSRDVIDHKQFESKSVMLDHLNLLNTPDNVEIVIIKKYTDIDAVTKQEKVTCKYHTLPKKCGM